MKQMRLLLVIVLVIAGLFGLAAGASAQTGTWVSGITIVNQAAPVPGDPSANMANITVTFYWAEGQALAGQVALSFTDQVPAGKSITYYVPTNPKTASLPANFVGSVVVSSDQPVAANVNTQLPSTAGKTPGDPIRVGTSSGVLDGYTKLYFTQVEKAYYGWNSYVAVQNTQDVTATVTIRYYNASDGLEVAAAAQTVDVHGYSSVIFRQLENANLPSGWVGSAVITSNQPVAGIANMFNDGTSPAKSAFLSYNGAGAGATTLFVPRFIRNFYGYNSGLTIQNIGAVATNVDVVFYFGANVYTTTITALGPNVSKVLYAGTISQLGSVSGSGSAIIKSYSADVTAIVNEDNRATGLGVTYNAMPAVEASQVVVFPQVVSRFYGYSGGIQVQNVGTADAHVTATFSMVGHDDVVVNATIGPNLSWSVFAPSVVPYKNFNGSVVVTSSDEDIIGFANSSYRQDVYAGDAWPASYGDSFTTYNGINK